MMNPLSLRRRHAHPKGCLSGDYTIDASDDAKHTTRSLSSQLQFVQENKSVLRLKLNGFVGVATAEQLGEIKELFTSDKRHWQSIKFHDNVQGCNYRRWLFKRVAVCRRMELLPEEIDVRFVTRVEISFNDMNNEAILALLRSIQSDHDVTTVAFTGYVKRQDVEEIIEAIARLVAADDRTWERIIFHPCFAGEGREYCLWTNTIKKYSRCLYSLSTQYTIPVGVKILDTKQ